MKGIAMMKKIGMYIVIVILAILLLSFAVYGQTSSSSGGGFAITSGINSSLQLRGDLDFDGVRVYWSAENREEYTHYNTDQDGNSWPCYHEKQTFGRASFQIEQGAWGYFFVPFQQEMELRRQSKETNNFTFAYSASFLLLEEQQAWENPPASSLDFQMFDVNLNSNTRIEHKINWHWNEETKENWAETTENLEGNFWFNLSNATTTQANVNVRNFSYWDNNQEYPGMEIRAFFDVAWQGSQQGLKVLSSMASSVIPGDANLDGIIDTQDFTLLKSNFGLKGEWTQGDFTSDGFIDTQDFTLLKSNFSTTKGFVPEPTGLIILGIGGLVTLFKKRR